MDILEHHENYLNSQCRALCLVCCSIKELDVVLSESVACIYNPFYGPFGILWIMGWYDFDVMYVYTPYLKKCENIHQAPQNWEEAIKSQSCV